MFAIEAAGEGTTEGLPVMGGLCGDALNAGWGARIPDLSPIHPLNHALRQSLFQAKIEILYQDHVFLYQRGPRDMSFIGLDDIEQSRW